MSTKNNYGDYSKPQRSRPFWVRVKRYLDENPLMKAVLVVLLLIGEWFMLYMIAK
jgi:hypothetical protein